MLKKAILSASVLALASGIALAQAPMSRDATTGRSVGMPSSSLSTNRWLASDIYKANVYDSFENKIGDVADLVMDSNGNVTTAIIGVGGFLGVGQKDIAVPFKDLKVSSRDGKDWLVINMTKDELMKAPAYSKTSAN
jgi:sporulation protein YlmC with PRC-barrel domain